MAKSRVETVEESVVPASANQYCLEAKHGAGIKDPSRFFTFTGDGCPECPVCGKQVSAAPVTTPDTYPDVIQAVEARL